MTRRGGHTISGTGGTVYPPPAEVRAAWAAIVPGDQVQVTDPLNGRTAPNNQLLVGIVQDTDGEGTVSLAIDGAQGIADLDGHVTECGHVVTISPAEEISS